MPVKFNPFTGQLQIDEKGSGGGSSYIDGEVQNFSALPQTVGSPAVDSAYLCRESEGTWLLSRKPAGIYIRTANTGVRASDWTYAGEFPDVFNDANLVVYNNTDSTKNVKFNASAIATGTTRTITVPNNDVTLPDQGTSTTDSPTFATVGASQVTFGSDSYIDVAQGEWMLNNQLIFSAVDPPSAQATLGLVIGTDVAAASHTHGNLTNDGKLGSTAGLPVVTTTAGAVTTLALGTANQVLRVNSGATGVEFADPAASGVTGAASSASDVLGVSGANITGVDANADRIVFWDDSASALKHLTVGSGLSLTDTTLTATATGTIGGSTSTDNAIVRADSTSNTVQESALVIDDAVVPFAITGDASTDIITAVGHNFTANQGVRFPTLTGGSGLTAATTNYFVRDISGDTFKVSTTSGGAAVNFTTNITAGTVIAMQANVAIRNNSSETNSALVLTPKGTGAFIVGPKPDGTSTGGDPRGSEAVDLQLAAKNNVNQVASGLRSVLIGGFRSRASGDYSVAIGAYEGAATGNGGVVMGGGTIGSSASGLAAVALGTGHAASANYSGILSGLYATADRYGIHSHAAGRFAATGDAQRIRAVLRNKTTNATATELLLDGSSARLTIPSGKVMAGIINCMGVKSDGSAVAHYVREFCGKNVAGTSSLVGSVTTIGTDQEDNASTDISVTISDANDAVTISVTGIASETWRWVASVDAVEVAYGT